ncbi:tetratricopeptide repeat protein [Thermophagus sp. OGC60D27]|uniref:tetratricopeptide repeat protein n=1 Tax=Thermophagus sp. OGC60D27 TaxID=3458415 RepID=UPI0040378388
MKYFGLISLVIFFFSSCSSIKEVPGKDDLENIELSNSKSIILSDNDQRKFDYYFLEGNRYKAIDEVNKSFMYFAEALKIDSTCAACAYELSRILLANNKVEDAQVLMERAVKYDPVNRYYIFLLSRIYQNQGNSVGAVKTAEKLIFLSESPSVEDLYFVAQLQSQNGLYEDAISNLEKIEKIIGIKEGLSFEIYQLYLENKDLKGAEGALIKLINRFPTYGDYRVLLGDFYLENNQYKKAFSEYDKVLQVQPDNGNVYFSLANYFFNQGDSLSYKEQLFKGFRSKSVGFENKFRRFLPVLGQFSEGQSFLDENDIIGIYEILIELHPYQGDIYHSYGNFLISIKKEKKARDVFRTGLDLDGSQANLWQDYLFLLSQLGENSELVSRSEVAISFFPDEPVFYLFHGVSLFQLEEYQKATVTLEKGLGLEKVKQNPSLKSQFHAYLGDIFHSMDIIDQSFHHYEESLKIDENNVIVLNNYSYYLALEGKELDRAEKMSAKTVELEPGNSTYLDTYAWILFKKKRYTEAKFIIERAIENLEQPNGVIYEHYGDILFKTGNLDGALEQWNKALDFGEHSKLLKLKIEKREYIDE